jgi:tetratricopeptide (TPR) repeat protein
LEHYQRFLDQHEHDDEKLAALAGALGQIVEISTDNGTYEDAESASRRRINIYQRLLEREPDSPEHLKFLAQSHAGLGNAYSQSERWEEAIAEHQLAAEILRGLRAKSPQDALLARWLATNLYNIGLRQVDLNYLDEALAAFLEGCEVLESLGPESLEQVDNAFLFATLANDASRRAGELAQKDLQQEFSDRTRAIATELVEKYPDSARYQRLVANANYYAAIRYKAEKNISQAIAAYREAEAGYQQAVKFSPNTLDHLTMLLVVQEGLGHALFQDRKPDEALEWLHQAMLTGERVLAQPTTATHYHFQIGQVFSSYGVALRGRGRTEEAIAVHQRAIELFRDLLNENPESAKVAQALAGNYLQLGRIYKEDQQNEEAIAAYREATSVYEAAMQANPRGFLIANNLARTYNNLGNAYVQNGQFDEAIATLKKAIPLLEQIIALGPQELREYRDLLAATHNNLSTAYAPRQQWSELKFHFEQALEIWAEVRPPAFVAQVSNGYAWKLAVAPYDEYRDGEKALRYATRACELTQWKNGGYLDTLAAAYAATGDFASAAKWQQKCIELAPADNRGEFEERLKLYQEGKAYRQPPAVMGEEASGDAEDSM